MNERKNVEESLQNERNQLRTLIDNIPDTIYFLDKDGRKVIANKADIDIIGRGSEAEVLGKTDLEMYPGETGMRFYTDSMAVIKSGEAKIDVEEEFKDRKGEKKYLYTSQYPIYERNGDVIGLVGIGHDITEKKKAAEELATKNKELQFLNKIAIELSQLSPSEDIEKFIPKQLIEFSGAVLVAFSEYSYEKKALVTKHIESTQSILKQVIKLTGRKLLGMESPVSDENFDIIVKEIAGVRKSSTEVTFGAIPEKTDKAIKLFTGVDRFYAIAYVVGNELFGTTMLGFKEGTMAPRIDLLAAFAHMAALSIQRRKAEERLKESEERYRLLIENQGEGVAIVDLKEKFIFVNPAAEEMFGVGSGGLLNRNLFDFVEGDQVQILQKETKKRSKAEKSSYEINITWITGEIRTVLITATPQFNKDGELTGTFGVFRDITERKLLEEKIIESEAYHRSLIDISPDGILTTDTEGNVNYGSIKAREIFGIPYGVEVEGTSILSWVDKDSVTKVMERYSKIIAGNISPETREYKLVKHNKSYFWGELSSSPLSDKNGNFTGLIIVCRDITNRKKAEDDLIRAKDKAEESDRLKTAFLHNISHEIRTPMNAITGFSALLNEPDLDIETQRSFIDIINQSGSQLLAIVTDIIEISNIEAGIVKFNQKELHLNSSLNGLLSRFKSDATHKGIEFTTENGLPDNQAIIHTDPEKLNQVILKILNNAFKFTDNGQIGFGYKLKSGNLEFYISDTGIGIAPEHHKRIFERFYQVETSLARQFEGTGLGLSIAKAYVEMLGGKIWLNSVLGRGTAFYFTIPYIQSGVINIADTPIPLMKTGISNSKNTILVAEDEETNYFLITQFLSLMNLNILHARNGKEAVDICQSRSDICLILMDIKMPVMDGYTATREIKRQFPEIPVIALTAYTYESDREKALGCGCSDYLSKPVKKDILIETISKYL